MTEKEAIKKVKLLGLLKFQFLTDNTLYYETVNPVLVNGTYKTVGIELYIKDGAMPTVFRYHEFKDFEMEYLQLAAINYFDTSSPGEGVYFSKYESINPKEC